MPLKLLPTVGLTFSALMIVGGCTISPPPSDDRVSVESLLSHEKLSPLGGPETSTFADVRSLLTPEEIRFLHEHIRYVEKYVNASLESGSVGSAWLAGYFRLESSLPHLRHLLLTDRYFYGWEGPNLGQESSYLLDEQYTHHLAYIAAIKAITGKPLRESVALTPAELQSLKSEADVDFNMMDIEPERVQHGLCARWLVQKLAPDMHGGP